MLCVSHGFLFVKRVLPHSGLTCTWKQMYSQFLKRKNFENLWLWSNVWVNHPKWILPKMFFGFLVGIFLCTSRPLSCCPDRVGWQARSWGEETKIARRPVFPCAPSCFPFHPNFLWENFVYERGNFFIASRILWLLFYHFSSNSKLWSGESCWLLNFTLYCFFFRWLSRMRIEHFCENVFITTSLQSEGVSVKMKKM